MKNPLQIKYLATLVAKLPKAKREALRTEILGLQEFIGSTDDLFIDGRKKMWAEGGSARTTTLARWVSTLAKPEPQTHRISWRSGASMNATTAEAVKISRRKSPGALAVTISKNGGKFSLNVDDDIATITRI